MHGILLVAQGMSCREVAGLLGDAHSTVANWVRRYDEKGLGGLVEGDRPGRPKRLTEEHLPQIVTALRKSPKDFGFSSNLWDGKTLAAFIGKQWSLLQNGAEFSERAAERQIHGDTREFIDENFTVWECKTTDFCQVGARL